MGGGGGRFHRVAAAGLGAAEVMLAVAVALLTLTGASARVSYYFVMQGTWCGSVFLISGCVTIAAGSSPTRSKILASMWLAVIASILAVVFLGLTTHSLVSGCPNSTCTSASYCSVWSSGTTCLSGDVKNVAEMINISGLVLGAAELCVAIAAAVICCDCNTSTADSNEASTISLRKATSDKNTVRTVAPVEHSPYQVPLVIQMAPYPGQYSQGPPVMVVGENEDGQKVTSKSQNPNVVLLPTVGGIKPEATRANKIGPEPERYVEVE